MDKNQRKAWGRDFWPKISEYNLYDQKFPKRE